MTRDIYLTFGRYNRWANERLYAAAADLDAADWRADRGVFFRSVCGTLNHIMVADRLWMARLTGVPAPRLALDTVLHEDRAELTSARRAEDARIIDFVTALPEERLLGTLRYANIKGEVFEQPLALVLSHMFNHQTHHRGQVHTLLTQSTGKTPELDLIYFMREA